MQRRQWLGSLLVDCILSMLIAFAIAAPLFGRAPQYAALFLLAAMFVPYLHLWLLHRRAVRRES